MTRRIVVKFYLKFAKIIRVALAHPLEKVRYESRKASVYGCPPFLKKDDPSGERENFCLCFSNFYDFLENEKDDRN